MKTIIINDENINEKFTKKKLKSRAVLGHINSISEERELTENEKKDGFTVGFYSINQILEMLNSKKGDNPRRLYFDRELQAVIDYYKERLQVRENTEIMR